MTEDLNEIESTYLQSLLDLFSIVVVVDRKLRIVFSSETLKRYVPAVEEESPLSEVFEVVRPRGLETYEDYARRLNTLYLLKSRDGRFAIRGQFLRGTEQGRDYLLFCGAPWLHWINTHCPEVKLGLNDFSHQDVQLDQLLYMATESNMVADLERLNAELKLAKEELEEAQAARNAFFSQMSHELRTPLNGIISAMTLMGQEQPAGRAGELLELARKSSDHMLHTLNYVLDIAKLEASEPGFGPVDFQLAEVIESVIDIVRPRALEKGLGLRVVLDAAVPESFHGDAESLRQVLLNFLFNAVKFTSAGQVSVEVEQARNEGMTVRLAVTDTGVGIPEEAQATVFEPFRTVQQDASEPATAGSGLGLDIARRSVRAMGGDIGLESREGVGSRFWIELPLETVAETVPQATTDADEHSPEPRFSGHVLLVDDNATNLTLMSMILESLGVRVTAASSGEQAIACVDEIDFDMVLMDISMPGMDGFEATRRIRSSHNARVLPIVALTAYSGSEERQRSVSSGMNGYLLKPLERDELTAVLGQYLEQEGAGSALSGAAEGAGSEAGLVDVDAIDSLRRQIGNENLVSVIDKFGGEVERRWPCLEKAASSEDLAREAHTLASTCASFGLPSVADQLREIEAHAKSGGLVEELDDLAQTGGQLRSSVEALRELVRAGT